MKDNLYSSKSDVWAFAIVLWEIGTLGTMKMFIFIELYSSLYKAFVTKVIITMRVFSET